MIEVLDISSKFDLVVEDAFCTAVSSAKDQELSAFKAQNHKLAKMDQIACRTLHNCMQQVFEDGPKRDRDRKSTRLNSSHNRESRMPSSA